MNPETFSALNHAFETFAHYEDSYGFARRVSVSHSLRELTSEDWDKMDEEFDMGVQLYSDDSTLLRHFLPRFLERLSEDFGSPLIELWDLSYRLGDACWLEWIEKEVAALRAVFRAWARELLTNDNAEMPIDFLIEIKEDLIPYLEIWLQARPHELAAWLLTTNWKHHQDSLRWAVLPHVEARLEAAFFDNPNGQQAELLSRSIEFVRSIRG